jgi:hypothetical protein
MGLSRARTLGRRALALGVVRLLVSNGAGGWCTHPLDPDLDSLGVPGTERSAGIDGAVEGQNARAACPRVGCGTPASE